MRQLRNDGVDIRRTKDVVAVNTPKFSFQVNAGNGTLAELTDRKTGINLWHGKTVGMSVYDELKGREFSDILNPVDVREIRIVRKHARCAVSITKRLKGADFEIKTVLSIGKDNFLWSVEFHKVRGPERSLRVTFHLAEPAEEQTDPNISGLMAWRLWAPVNNAPFNISGSNTPGTLVFSHGKPVDGSDEIPIPGIVCYDPSRDVGMTFLKPFEEICPRVFFEVDQREGNIRIDNRHVGLKNDYDPVISLYVAVHEGDWRAGLGWIFNRYREYFVPQNTRIFAQEGVMHYGKMLTEQRVREWTRKMGFKWQEIPYFRDILAWGPNTPTKEPWDAVWPDIPQIKVKSMTYRKANDYVRMLKKHGVAGFIYHNSGDFSRQIAEEKYPESIIKLRDGSPHVSWRAKDPSALPEARGVLMNPDPGLPYGQWVLRELEIVFQKFPGLAGIFIDQCCYPRFDFGKDDGRTMVDNRRCEFTLYSYMKLHERIWAFLKKHGKTSFSNGPFCPQIQKHTDAIMAEGTYVQMAYFALAKPLVLLQVGECAFKWCLKYGAFPHVAPLGREYATFYLNEAPLPKKDVLVYRKYLPLLEFMRGRKWVLTPHALTLPPACEGNIFETRAGNYIVTVMSSERSIMEKQAKRETMTVRVRLRDGKAIRKAELLSVDASKSVPVKLVRNGGDICFDVPRFITAGVVHLRK